MNHPVAPPVALGELFADRYQLERMVARGGMGSVWVAQDVKLHRPVAIKFMDGENASSDEARTRFHREASAAAGLRTPYAVQIYDHGVHDNTPFIVMELLEGETLAERLRREQTLSLQDAATVVAQVAKGLRRAHEVGIVHRDLKPQNIFIHKSYDEEIVKILDFGVAKAVLPQADDVTKTGAIFGSPLYMSPEQTRGSRTLDHRSDLWSLGVILYRALTGKLPYSGNSFGDVIAKICFEPFPPPSSIASLPVEVDEFFERALARDPEQRFQSAREFSDAFAVIAGEPGLVASPSIIPGPPIFMAPGPGSTSSVRRAIERNPGLESSSQRRAVQQLSDVGTPSTWMGDPPAPPPKPARVIPLGSTTQVPWWNSSRGLGWAAACIVLLVILAVHVITRNRGNSAGAFVAPVEPSIDIPTAESVETSPVASTGPSASASASAVMTARVKPHPPALHLPLVDPHVPAASSSSESDTLPHKF